MDPFDPKAHSFTPSIIDILGNNLGSFSHDLLARSPLLGYLNYKTKAADRESKSRRSYANHYALYVLVEDYVKRGFADGSARVPYHEYEGAKFKDLFKRQRELPMGQKLQNHALNSRLNEEFQKCFPDVRKNPIVRNLTTKRYWINEELLKIEVPGKNGTSKQHNIAHVVLKIIRAYVNATRASFFQFLEECAYMSEIAQHEPETAAAFVRDQLQKNVDARIFEIVSYAILKVKYGQENIWIRHPKGPLLREPLILYKTGRTNANDGGIDFVMRPLGRFFQVTETADASKFFLDIEKIQRFPITFVVKSLDAPEQIRSNIREKAMRKHGSDEIAEKYMQSIEEIINLDYLIQEIDHQAMQGELKKVIDEIAVHSRLEFNLDD